MELAGDDRVEESAALLEDAMVWFPDDPGLRLHAGALALMAHQPSKAKEHLRQAVELAPDDPGVLTHAASHMDTLHEEQLVEQWVRKAAGIAPDDFDLAGHLSYLMSLVLLRHGYLDRAEEMARAGFEADPSMPEHGGMLAGLLEARGELDEARVVIEESLEQAPGDSKLESALERLAAESNEDEDQ